MAPDTPQRSEHPRKPVVLLDVALRPVAEIPRSPTVSAADSRVVPLESACDLQIR